jgi:hypothetical protein
VLVRPVITFNGSWTGSTYTDHNAGMVTALIESENLTYPRFTYDEIAIPEVGITNLLTT